MINAKMETVDTLRTYKAPFAKRRCLVPADGFYEWKPTGLKRKQPYRFVLNSGDIFYFAGLWENSKDADGNPIRTYTILTTTPNSLVQPVHNRMPVILRPELHQEWLAPEATTPRLKESPALLERIKPAEASDPPMMGIEVEITESEPAAGDACQLIFEFCGY